jgi:hypothetical protein
VREVEQLEAQITTGGLLLPQQLHARLAAVRALCTDLEDVLAMKNVILRTLQNTTANQYIELEMQHQR